MTQPANLMFDAITPANIPADAVEVAGYVDGKFVWSDADWARFTLATLKLRITAIPMNLDADVCDCENGDYTPSQAAQWAKGRLTLGKRPIIYCNLSTWNTVKWELSLAGISVGQVDFWIAHYTQVEHLEPGSAATQYADPGPVDLSETAPGWTADQTPSPQPEELDMPLSEADVHFLVTNPLFKDTLIQWMEQAVAMAWPTIQADVKAVLPNVEHAAETIIADDPAPKSVGTPAASG